MINLLYMPTSQALLHLTKLLQCIPAHTGVCPHIISILVCTDTHWYTRTRFITTVEAA